ncbi:MAG: WD40 repeat domain-containing protein [Blastochloris sp.]|nr:WD40 repeat domain-containing protein [Blastochloris sp.]
MKTSLKWTLILTLLAVCTLKATQSERVILDTTEDFLAGKSPSVSIDEPGQLSPGPNISRLADLKDRTIWSAAQDGKTGDIILGTGPEGEVYRVSTKGKVQKLTAFLESDVYAVALGLKGEIYVASSPKGKIFIITSAGKVEEYFNPKEQFIWSMVVNKRGELFVATGSAGKIYRVTGKKAGNVFYDSDESNIRVLALDKDGALLAGSADKGYLYRITEEGKAVVLLDSDKEEISALAVQPDGTIFAAAIGKRSMPEKAVPLLKLDVNKTSPPQPNESFSSEPGESKAIVVPKAMAMSSAASKSEGALLYRLSASYYPEQIWKCPQPILSLLADEKNVWIGVASEGYIYQYTAEANIKRLGKVQASDVTVLLKSKASELVLAVTSNSGQVFEIGRNTTTEHLYYSKVIDSALFSEWGKLNVFGDGKWTVRTRSGNTSDPDKSWYPWKNLNGNRVDSPAARYIQFEITLTSGIIGRIEFTYLPQNQPPAISAIKILEPGLGYELLGQPTQPPSPQSVEQLLKASTVALLNQDRFQPLQKSGLRTVVWQATDANKDQLEYKIEIKREGQEKWDVLAEDLTLPLYSWETNSWLDGVYYFRITADDKRENTKGKSLTGQRLSEAWKIDNTAPILTLSRKNSELVEVEVADATSLLRTLEVSTDGQHFRPVQPVDGIIDSMSESFSVKWDKKAVLYFRAEDESNNISGLRVIP